VTTSHVGFGSETQQLSNISPLMLIYAEHQLHTNYSSMKQATFRLCGRILVVEHYSVGTKKATEDNTEVTGHNPPDKPH